MTAHRTFVPAAGHDHWLKFYDPLTTLLGAPALHRTLIEQAALAPTQRVLDIGCGTGSLAIMLKRERPDLDVVALDPDANALAIARRKAARAGVSVAFVQGFADAIDAADASFDRVLSSLMLHHLTLDERRATLVDVLRVLKPGGSFHVADFTASHGARGFVARLLHREDHLKHGAAARFTTMLTDAGFSGAAEVSVRRTLFGPVAFHRATRPEPVGAGGSATGRAR